MKDATQRPDTQTQLLRLQKTQTVLSACILVVILAAGIFLACRFTSISRCIDLIEQDLQALNMDTLNDAVDAFTEAADRFGSLDMDAFNRTVESLEDAAEQIGGMDIDRLNGAVSSLKNAADTFGKIDVEALNSLVEALETVSAKLQNAVNAITGIFH